MNTVKGCQRIWLILCGIVVLLALIALGVNSLWRARPFPTNIKTVRQVTDFPALVPSQDLQITRTPTATFFITLTTKPSTTPLPTSHRPTFFSSFTATATPIPTLNPALGIGLTQISPTDGMLQVYVPAGEFLMGSDKAKDSQANNQELPQHTVYLDAFWIDQTVVTNAQYARCAARGQCTPPHDASSNSHSSYYGDSQFANYPVIYVDWNQAQAYCQWAGRRLPSEAEWEKAARGVDGRIYPWGNAAPDQSKLTFGSLEGGDTTAVGSYPSDASPYGALDIAGNVWEWVNDWYSDTYYQQSPSRNPTGPPSGDTRVLRGGSWYNDISLTRSAFRIGVSPDFRDYNVGFRCAASP